jgi:hypothetical protein
MIYDDDDLVVPDSLPTCNFIFDVTAFPLLLLLQGYVFTRTRFKLEWKQILLMASFLVLTFLRFMRQLINKANLRLEIISLEHHTTIFDAFYYMVLCLCSL